jgi:hypothetical protein
MKSTAKKARQVDLADFDLQELEALDPSNNFGQQKVRLLCSRSLSFDTFLQ